MISRRFAPVRVFRKHLVVRTSSVVKLFSKWRLRVMGVIIASGIGNGNRGEIRVRLAPRAHNYFTVNKFPSEGS